MAMEGKAVRKGCFVRRVVSTVDMWDICNVTCGHLMSYAICHLHMQKEKN